MHRSSVVGAAAALIMSLAACGSSGGTQPTGARLALTTTSPTVVANGTNTVAIHVDGAAKGPIVLTTTRGSFSTGGQVAQIASTSGDVTLQTCNSSTDNSCSGTAAVTATDGALNSGQLSITFASVADCATNCALDAACAGAACTKTNGATGQCSGTPLTCVVAACTPAAATETNCSDGRDDDCNGAIDCADTQCDGQPCKSGASSWVCVSKVCTDTSSSTPATGSYGLAVAPAATRLPAVSGAQTAVKITVVKGSTPAASTGITVDTTSGTLTAGTTTAATVTTTTDASGVATVTFTASGTAGTATITAKVTAAPTASLSASVDMPALGQIVADAPAFAVMGVRDSGFNETNHLNVTAFDDQGKPYPAGLTVTFQHVSLAGSAISVPGGVDTATCKAAAGCVQATTDANGNAAVTLVAGTQAGTLTAAASATAGGPPRAVSIPAVAAIGAKASGTSFSIVCSPRNVPALAETTCSTSLVDAPFTCAAILQDRYGNLLGRSTEVIFRSEAAADGHVAVTPQYDPAKDPSAQADLGTAIDIFNTLGGGLPLDVAAASGEPSSTYDDACGLARVHNPRDGAVTIIAIADGEESFIDVNGNGKYDGPNDPSLAGTAYAASGEPFTDVGEPFVDANDNGVWDPGEWFMDVDGDGKYTGPDGKWSANVKLWTETVVVYTTNPMTVPAAGGKVLGTRWVASADVATFVDGCTPTPPPPLTSATSLGAFEVSAAAKTQALRVVASDGNLNRLATAAGYAVALESPGKATVRYDGLPSYSDETGFFFRYWPCDVDGANCNSYCAAAPGKLPCRMKPAIFGYSCGIDAGVVVTAPTQPDGVQVIDWTVQLPYDRYGSSRTTQSILKVEGTSD